ncbi:YcnI family protein [Agromyces intestinalis]|uniref:YcnI family protein n=1 Tax=Agromyces intestinalis TaxID=2592652 RepID=A0A5C1YJM3_9MICO|nr:YcnI family protein [Agromyces intestinalis]QEO15022.1 YcnI family protein [Agromyces intestinalis]
MRIARLTAAGLGAGALFALAAVPLAASAHVTVTPGDAPAGASAVLTFSVGHGCDGSPTTALTVDIPENVLSVTPTVKPGWTVEKVMVPLDEPAEGAHGDTVTERVGQVVYTAETPLPDGYRDTIEVQVRTPDDAAGTTLAFPVLQTCVEGETNWADLPTDDGAEPESPAPTIAVTEAAADEHGASTASGGHDGHDASGDAAASTDASQPAASEPDVLARVLGIGGLVVGVVGIVLAIAARAGKRA